MQSATSDPGPNQPSPIPFLQSLQLIHFALGMGVVLFCVVVLFLVMSGTDTASAGDSFPVKTMSWVHLAFAASSYPIAMIAFKMMIKSVVGVVSGGTIAAAGAKLQAAYLVRLALFEGVALFGLVAVMLAGQAVLRDYPVYWTNLLSTVIFLLLLACTFPTRSRVEALFQ